MRIRVSFAVRREKYIEDIENKLHGALGEYYKAELAAFLGHTTHIADWDGEVEQHFLEYAELLTRKIKSPFNRMVALEQALNLLVSEHDKDERKYAIKRCRSYGYNVPASVTVDSPLWENAKKTFIETARDIAEETFQK